MANQINVYHESIDDFNSNYPESTDNFIRVAQWNVRGLNNLEKFDNVLLFLDSVKVSIDVLVLGETWLKADNCPLYQIPNYDSVFSCRGTSSGGLAVYVKKGLSFNVVQNMSTEGMHLIHTEVKMNGRLYDVVGVYRPPSFDFTKFHDELENILSGYNSRPLFIVGDVNIPINLSNNNVVLRYKSLLESYDCVCSNTFVTRPISNNVLDHFVTRKENLINVRNDTIYSDISDHLIIISSTKITNPKEYVVLTTKIVNKPKLNQLFSDFVNNFTCCEDVNESIVILTSAYQRMLNECTKLKSEKVNVKTKHCPWLNFYVWQWIKLKNKYLKKVKDNPNNHHLKDMLNHVTKKVKTAKKRCKKEYFENLLNDTCHAKLWKNLNEIMGRKKQDSKIELNYDGYRTSNNLEICEIFNQFFSNIGGNLAKTIQKNNVNPLCTVNRIEQTVFLKPTDENETISVINELNIKKSCGPDNFPSSIIKSNKN